MQLYKVDPHHGKKHFRLINILSLDRNDAIQFRFCFFFNLSDFYSTRVCFISGLYHNEKVIISASIFIIFFAFKSVIWVLKEMLLSDRLSTRIFCKVQDAN